MDVGSRCSRLRILVRLVAPLVLIAALTLATPVGLVLAQIDPQVRNRVVPGVAEIAILLDQTENGATEPIYLPVGSGTIVSPDGLILTNHHVIDMAAHRADLDAWEAQATDDGESLTFVLDENQVLVLGTDGTSVPEPVYTAEVVAEDHALDLAVLRITGDETGVIVPSPPALPFVPLGDSSSVRQGDPIDLFGYPMIGGDTLTYTDGVVSGFDFEEGIDGVAWITTNATMSGGSSGGTALDRAGQLIGVPTQGTQLDYRPGDTNGDGTIDAEDIGCIPMGGSIGQLRPINLAKPLLLEAGWLPVDEGDAVEAEPAATEPPPATEVPVQPTPEEEPVDSPKEPKASETATLSLGVGAQEETADDTLQNVADDVPTYWGNPARTGEMPGPDPGGQIGELWRVETGQTNFSSPAVVDGVVFLGTGDWTDATGAVLALDATTGEERWRFESLPFLSSPAVSEGRVFIGSLDGNLYTLLADDGSVIRQSTPLIGSGKRCELNTAPLITGEVIVANFLCVSDPWDAPDSEKEAGGILAAFDPATGAERWQFPFLDINALSSPALDDGIVVVASGENDESSAGTVYGVDAATGQEIWRFSAETAFDSLTISGGVLFIVGSSGDLFALDLLSGSERWRTRPGVDDFEFPAVANDVVYVGGGEGKLYKLDANTGVEIGTIALGEIIEAAPVLTATSAYVVSTVGTLFMVDLASGDVEIVAHLDDGRNDPYDPLAAQLGYLSPAVIGGQIFVVDAAGGVRAYGDPEANTAITEGMPVEVVVNAIALRAAPSSASVSRGELPRGARLHIIGASEEREGQMWWPVEAKTAGTGWVPESAIVAAEVPPTSTDLDPTPTPGPGITLDPSLVDIGEVISEESYCLTSPLYPPGTEIVLARHGVLLFPRPEFDPASDPINPTDDHDAIDARFRPRKGIPSDTVVEITGPLIETGTCDVWPIRYQLGQMFEGFIDEQDLRPAD